MTSHPGTGALRTPALYSLGGGPPPPWGGDALGGAEPPVADAVLAWDAGRVTYAGPASGWTGAAEPVAGAIVPGFVDAHTHLPFVGWRADEFEARLAGQTYRDLHGGEGGIFRSARLFADA